jgi:hypothetical protein
MLLLAVHANDGRLAIAFDRVRSERGARDYGNLRAERGAGRDESCKVFLILAGKGILDDGGGCNLAQDRIGGNAGLAARLVNQSHDLPDLHRFLPSANFNS